MLKATQERVLLEIISLTLVNAVCCASPQVQAVSDFNSSLIGRITEARLGCLLCLQMIPNVIKLFIRSLIS